MMWLWLLGLAGVSGGLYRLGGWGDEGRKKYPKLPGWFFDTKARDVGCAIVCFIAVRVVLNVDVVWWLHLVSFGLLWGALTTYWDWINGKDNHFLHGFGCALAYLPYAIALGAYPGLCFRSAVLAALMGIWSYFWGNDVVEEVGRGVALILTLPIMFVV